MVSKRRRLDEYDNVEVLGWSVSLAVWNAIFPLRVRYVVINAT